MFPHSFITAVKYRMALADDTIVAETPEGGVEFHVKDGIFIELFRINCGIVPFFHLIV